MFVAFSYSCRRAYGKLDPYSQVPELIRRGLATILARNAPVSTGDIPADSFAIFRVYVSVTLSALNLESASFRESLDIALSTLDIFIFIFKLSSALSSRTSYADLYLSYASLVFRTLCRHE